ncbi:protein ENHANCED DISEASE RESISTANCE 4-like [Phoenix dactylifera]|uniref:Protein ENHANCED DISEASE RESISTANCE 4-like n=1 Tax=Phoenix dactylifera TaxID=42345 RepID=A0A8B9AY25_PHODC|nr:protein ENHANCED DISEASE RESISTANCE 4-like [Phoenix dactylifera]XP_038988309.1 protein ENHANCED DISEASE RESISTANCE 4-like [Phoenix dactylifera]
MEGSSTKFRVVRCPKCLKLLVEYADTPVYQCGGCSTVLRAKNSTAAGENVNTKSTETNNSESLADNGFSDNGSTSSVKQMIACSTSAHSSELEREEKETMLSNIYSSYSSAEHNQQEDGETSGKENGSNTNQLAVRSDASQSQPDEGFHSKTEVEESLERLQQHSGSSKVMNKVEEPPDSSQSVASEEDTVERGSGDGLDLSYSQDYDGSISSSDAGCNNRTRERFLRRSGRTFKQPKVLDMADIKGKRGSQMTIDVEADLQVSRTLSSKLSNERHGSDIMRSFNMKRDEFSSKYGMYELDKETSFHSEDFHSVQNWMEPENGPTGSPSRGSHFQHDFSNSKSSKHLRYDRVNSLRNMDELKKLVHGFWDQRTEGRKPYFRGTDCEQQFYHKSKNQPPQYFKSNLLHRPPDALYGPRQITSQQYQFSQMAFSGEPCCSCLHSRLEDQRLQLQSNRCIDDICRAHAYTLCSHSSAAGSSRTLDHEQELLRYNEKRKPKKNHCRPISGGAPFIICCNCFELLQLPADFLVLRRRLHKLQCAACSKVLALSFPAKACISPLAPPIKEVHLHAEEADRTLHISRNSSAGKNVKQTSGSQLHRLMGYSSASELLYRRWDIDGGYESI